MSPRAALEIAVQDAAGARRAIAAGADRVELCQALRATGGLTPSIGSVAAVAAAVGSPERLAVLVRPRPGGFVYDAQEVDVVAADIAEVRRCGAGSVVVGALTPAGEVDRRALDAWVDAADGGEVVFHRAIDTLLDPVSAIAELVDAGVRRVLTSGGQVRSIDGAGVLADLVAEARGRLQIMAGGGVRVADIDTLVDLGVDAVHLSAACTSDDLSPSGPGGGVPGHEVTDGALVGAAVAALRAVG